jgi:hypothetical protein
MADENKELREFVNEALIQIKDGVEQHSVHGPVKFDVAVAKIIKENGDLGIKVLGVGGTDAGAEVRAESVSKLKFEVMIKEEERSEDEGGSPSDKELAEGDDLLNSHI